MNEIDKAKEYATKEWPIIWSELSCDVQDKVARVMAGFATATAKIERLRGLLADVMESSLGMTQGAIGRVQSFQDAEAFLTTLEPKDGEL